jgi:hypothetical protein
MNTLSSPQRLAIGCRVCRQLVLPSVFAIAIFAPGTSTRAGQQLRTSVWQVASSDFAAAEALMNHIAALSPRVRKDEAARVAAYVYNAAGRLRRDYRVVWPPLFNNFLVNNGIRKRGLCFQWAEDLLVTLDTLKLTSLELRWGEADAGTWQESNCLVITAKGQAFNTGIIVDCWRHSGHPYWTAVANDKVSWVENSAYAHFVRVKSAPKAFGANRQVALQTKVGGERKIGKRLVEASAKAH